MTPEQLRQLEQAANGRHDPCAMCDGQGPWPAPWVVTDDIKGDGHWDNEFHVVAEGGDGYHLATFEFRHQAELFVAAVNALPALLDIAELAEQVLTAFAHAPGRGASEDWDEWFYHADPQRLAAALSRLEGATDVD